MTLISALLLAEEQRRAHTMAVTRTITDSAWSQETSFARCRTITWRFRWRCRTCSSWTARHWRLTGGGQGPSSRPCSSVHFSRRCEIFSSPVCMDASHRALYVPAVHDHACISNAVTRDMLHAQELPPAAQPELVVRHPCYGAVMPAAAELRLPAYDQRPFGGCDWSAAPLRELSLNYGPPPTRGLGPGCNASWQQPRQQSAHAEIQTEPWAPHDARAAAKISELREALDQRSRDGEAMRRGVATALHRTQDGAQSQVCCLLNSVTESWTPASTVIQAAGLLDAVAASRRMQTKPCLWQ